jgi:hypothetical protein
MDTCPSCKKELDTWDFKSETHLSCRGCRHERRGLVFERRCPGCFWRSRPCAACTGLATARAQHHPACDVPSCPLAATHKHVRCPGLFCFEHATSAQFPFCSCGLEMATLAAGALARPAPRVQKG